MGFIEGYERGQALLHREAVADSPVYAAWLARHGSRTPGAPSWAVSGSSSEAEADGGPNVADVERAPP